MIRWTPLGLIVVAALGMGSIRDLWGDRRFTRGKITPPLPPPSTPSTPEILMLPNNGNSDRPQATPVLIRRRSAGRPQKRRPG